MDMEDKDTVDSAAAHYLASALVDTGTVDTGMDMVVGFDFALFGYCNSTF